MESISPGGKSGVVKSSEGGVSCPNPDHIEERRHNSATLCYVEYYYPKYSCYPRFDWDEKILVEKDTALPRDPSRSNGGCEQSVQETK
jgi:hypothetical protein